MPEVTTESGQAPPLIVTETGEPDYYLTPEEVSSTLRVAPSTLGQWRYRSEGPRWVKLKSGVIRYRASVVQAWIADCEATTA